MVVEGTRYSNREQYVQTGNQVFKQGSDSNRKPVVQTGNQVFKQGRRCSNSEPDVRTGN